MLSALFPLCFHMAGVLQLNKLMLSALCPPCFHMAGVLQLNKLMLSALCPPCFHMAGVLQLNKLMLSALCPPCFHMAGVLQLNKLMLSALCPPCFHVAGVLVCCSWRTTSTGWRRSWSPRAIWMACCWLVSNVCVWMGVGVVHCVCMCWVGGYWCTHSVCEYTLRVCVCMRACTCMFVWVHTVCVF